MQDSDQMTTSISSPAGAGDLTWVEGVMEDAAKIAHVSSVFGEPYKVGDKTIIPVASVRYMMGFGAGTGQGMEPSGNSGQTGSGSGGGGGGITTARPVAVIEVSNGKVEIKPITETVTVALAGMLLAGWNVYWISRTIRERIKRSG